MASSLSVSHEVGIFDDFFSPKWDGDVYPQPSDSHFYEGLVRDSLLKMK